MMQDYESSCLLMWLQRKLGRPVRLPEHIPISAECLLNVAVMFTIYEMEPTLLCFFMLYYCNLPKLPTWQNCSIFFAIHTFIVSLKAFSINVSIILIVYLNSIYTIISIYAFSNILFEVFIISCLWPKRYDIKILLKLNT